MHVVCREFCYIAVGDGEYGDKTVTDFADEYIIASQQNTQHYSAPLVVFAFFDGITRSIAGEMGHCMCVLSSSVHFRCAH